MKKRLTINKEILLVSSAAVFFIFLSLFTFAVDPQGPNQIDFNKGERFTNNSQGVLHYAQAGNVTPMTINLTRITESWQGYYGNITGRITLDDANNFTMYDWSMPNPTGLIFASNYSIVTWSKIYCMNVSSLRNVTGNNGAGDSPGVIYNINGSQIELNFGINSTDRDGLDETFNDTYTDATGFKIGTVEIDDQDGCSMAHPYSDDNYNSAIWQELLLTDNTSLVFTGIIEDNAQGFQSNAGALYDFQLLVLEDGHAGSELEVTPYYFFVQLS